MPVKTDPTSLGFLLTDVSRLLRAEFERRIAAAGLGLTPGEARALLHIDARPGSRQNAIAEHMAIEPMTLCRYVDRLESNELVERLPDPTDRRAKNVTTTTKGRTLVEEVLIHTRIMMNDIQSGLDDSQRQSLRNALLTIQLNLTGSASFAHEANG